jgi:hypothetical protein
VHVDDTEERVQEGTDKTVSGPVLRGQARNELDIQEQHKH